MEGQKESLCQRYVHFQESKLNAGSEVTLEETTMCALGTKLLKAQQDPTRRFEIHFYQIISNAFSREMSSNFDLLQKAFEVFENLCINLLIYPWRKEFKRIKTYTPAFVHYVWSAMCGLDALKLLACIGYCQEQEAGTYCYKGPKEPQHLRKLAFEFFLAQLECRHLADAFGSQQKESTSEDGTGCLGDGQNEHLISKQNCKVNLGKLDIREGLTSEKHCKRTSLLTHSPNTVNEEGRATISSLSDDLDATGIALSEQQSDLNWDESTGLGVESASNCDDLLLKTREDNAPVYQLDDEHELSINFQPCNCQTCRLSLASLVCLRCGLAACTVCCSQPASTLPYHCEHEFRSFTLTFRSDTC